MDFRGPFGCYWGLLGSFGLEVFALDRAPIKSMPRLYALSYSML